MAIVARPLRLLGRRPSCPPVGRTRPVASLCPVSPCANQAPENSKEEGSRFKLHWVIFERTPRHLNVVKRHGVIRELLVSFVAFTSDQDNVAWLRKRDGAGDCFCAVNDFLVITRTKSSFDVRNDCCRVFFARIVRSD